MAVTADAAELVPGSNHDAVVLTFWADEARTIVAKEARFSVWYGGTAGEGSVRSVGWNL